MLLDITESNIAQVIEGSYKKPVIIDAYAEWCGPCQQMAPLFDSLAQEFSTLYTFAKLNVDDYSDIANQYKIRSIPTILFFKDGTLVAVKAGFMTIAALKAEIEKAFK